ncbi:cell division protein FtsQ [Nocardia amikacinitolerans]|uniref:cell division protein FtsQ/DivIB n=1 Tax=Nocardia amikacinitolerans TaxID=756689 RepID=UPI000A06CEB8|nr:FtsQ-type POTRA domain-containing protein [Nocardia amikacinitolerans]MCP2318167.1 cell division protein FtsQ [Nocardia amikacinitolerans]
MRQGGERRAAIGWLDRFDLLRRPGGPARLRRMRLWGLLGVCVLTVVLLISWFTPVLSVRTVEIEGLVAVQEAQVRERLEIPSGRSMLRIDTDAMARRVASIPKVSSARVQRVYPSTVKVTIVERAPVLFFESPEGAHLLDAESVEFAIEAAPIGVPKLITEQPGGADPVTRAAVAVLAVLPPALNIQVGEVVARSISDISLNLHDGRTVLWGGANDAERKAAVVLPLLTREGTVFDVSSPNLVTVK